MAFASIDLTVATLQVLVYSNSATTSCLDRPSAGSILDNCSVQQCHRIHYSNRWADWNSKLWTMDNIVIEVMAFFEFYGILVDFYYYWRTRNQIEKHQRMTPHPSNQADVPTKCMSNHFEAEVWKSKLNQGLDLEIIQE